MSLENPFSLWIIFTTIYGFLVGVHKTCVFWFSPSSLITLAVRSESNSDRMKVGRFVSRLVRRNGKTRDVLKKSAREIDRDIALLDVCGRLQYCVQ